jgi:hypothetical protein
MTFLAGIVMKIFCRRATANQTGLQVDRTSPRAAGCVKIFQKFLANRTKTFHVKHFGTIGARKPNERGSGKRYFLHPAGRTSKRIPAMKSLYLIALGTALALLPNAADAKSRHHKASPSPAAVHQL